MGTSEGCPNESLHRSKHKPVNLRSLRSIAMLSMLFFVLIVIGAFVVSNWLHPPVRLEIRRSATIVDVRVRETLPAVTKFKVINNSDVVIHHLKVSIPTDIYVKQAAIVVNSLLKHSLEETPDVSYIQIEALPPGEFFVVTVFGVFNRTMSAGILNGSETTVNNLAQLSHKSHLASISDVRSDERLWVQYNDVSAKEILDEEVGEGFAVHRFVVFSVNQNQNGKESIEAPDLVDVRVAPSEQAAIATQLFVNNQPVAPTSESPIVVLGAQDNSNHRIPYLSRGYSLSFKSDHEGEIFILYCDVLCFFYPNYTSTISLKMDKN